MSQKTDVLMMLKNSRQAGVTPLEALSGLGCLRLAARVFNLREDGHEILTTRHADGYAIYTLIKVAS